MRGRNPGDGTTSPRRRFANTDPRSGATRPRRQLPPPTPLVAQAFSIPKIGETLDKCEDAYALSPRLDRCAVSDGASSSFGARRWAEHLVDRVVELAQPFATSDEFAAWVPSVAHHWDVETEASAGGWWADVGSDRGAFATLLAVWIDINPTRGARWAAVALGDSCLFHVRDHEVHTRFPLSQRDEFNLHPPLVGTIAPHFSTDHLRHRTGDISRGDTLVLVTDAVAEWAVTDDRRIEDLSRTPIDELEHSLGAVRAGGEIANDDLTVVRVTFR